MRARRRCRRCHRYWDRHPITLEPTCFVHGRPDGSLAEQQLWKATNTSTNTVTNNR